MDRKQLPRKSTDHNKLAKKLRRLTGRAIADYGMIDDGDRIMVCLSGGKDSYALLDVLMNLHHAAPVDFEIVAVALDWSSAEEVREYSERHQLSMPVLLAEPAIRQRWQVKAYPSYYVLDDQHRVARRDIGYSSQFGLWWRAQTVR